LPWSTWATMARLRRSARIETEPAAVESWSLEAGMVERAMSVMGGALSHTSRGIPIERFGKRRAGALSLSGAPGWARCSLPSAPASIRA